MRTLITILVLALLAASAAADPAADVVIGEYKLVRVVDGDTVRVQGLDNSLRLLGIDTEETFKHDKERRAYAKGFVEYAKAARGVSMRPAKFATPLGDTAKTWAEAWFAGVDKVRLERDDPHEIRDRYHRYLAYVLVEKRGKWLNYNVEAVRAGMSPYFPKYGRSRRFDRDFIAAEAEAKAAKRGIWAPGAEAYPDYPEREAWWTARGDFVAAFHKEAEAGAKHVRMIDLTHDDAAAQLEANVGTEVVVLGTVGEVDRGGPKPHRQKRGHGRGGNTRGADRTTGDSRAAEPTAGNALAGGARAGGVVINGAADDVADAANDGPAGGSATVLFDGPGDADESWTEPDDSVSESRPHGKGPTRVILDNHIPLVFFDPDVLAASGVEAWKGEWIRVTAKPSLYHGRLEIVIDRTAQIELSPVPGLTKPTAAPPAKSSRNRKQSVPIPAP